MYCFIHSFIIYRITVPTPTPTPITAPTPLSESTPTPTPVSTPISTTKSPLIVRHSSLYLNHVAVFVSMCPRYYLKITVPTPTPTPTPISTPISTAKGSSAPRISSRCVSVSISLSHLNYVSVAAIIMSLSSLLAM
jgi:hypothetical protein